MKTINSTILLAEDDQNLGKLLKEFLLSEGFDVSLAENGKVALEMHRTKTFDLLLLDVMMPIKDGFSVAEEIRKDNPTIPIVFITAKSLKADKIIGYKLGADDYITKPFDEEELVWKIRAILRKAPNQPLNEIVAIGNYQFDTTNQVLSCENFNKRITEKENKILNFLVQNKNKVIRKEAALVAIWGKDDYFLGRSLDVFISKFRKYFSEDERIKIENVFGVGFVFHVPE